MQPEDRDIAFLWDILEAAKDIHDFVRKTTLKEFSSDKKTRYAVERQLLVIGEAAKRVSENYKQKHKEIPWKSMVGLRNILAHEYGEVLVERIWLIATENIPALMLVNLAEKEKKKKHTLAFIDEESDKLVAKLVNVL